MSSEKFIPKLTESKTTGHVVEVYCDGSVAEARIVSLTSSTLGGENVGRIAILAPKLDLGILEQVNETDSQLVEFRAVERAIEIFEQRAIENYVIITDNESAVQVASRAAKQAKWVWRGKNCAGRFLDKIIHRAGYLRGSLKRQPRRRVNQRHEEIFQLFNTVKAEFKLSEKILGREILRDLAMIEKAP